MTKPETTRHLLSSAIDCLTKISEDEFEFSDVKNRCRMAKSILEDAAFDCQFVEDEEAA